MFQKPFKIKSQTILRGSDKKKLHTRVKEQLKSDEAIFTNKEEVKKVKIFSNRGDSCFVYCFRGNPMMFEIHEKIYPSVYLLWEMNKMVARIKTHPNVIQILIGGADLMLPGIVTTENEDYFEKSFTVGDVVSVSTTSSNWPVAVGNALITSQLLLENQDRGGKAVNVVHVFGDHLWQMGEKTSPPKQESSEDDSGDAAIEESIHQMSINDTDESSTVKTDVEDKEEVLAEENEQNASNDKDMMDQLLYDCFLTALKTKLKDKELPMLTSNFYRNSVLSCCPEDQTLEVKKTSYKKLGVFIKKMVDMEIIKTKEISKGSEGIIQVNRSNHTYRSFEPLSTPEKPQTEVASTEIQYGILIQNSYTPPEISTLYRISPQVHGIFQPYGIRKNTSLPLSDIRKYVTQYVTQNDLKRDMMVLMDPILHRVVCASDEGHITQLPWDAVYKRLLTKLPTDHQLKFPGISPIIGKGNPPSIEILVEKRINNKNMTIIKHLDKFLIDAQEFGSQMKKLAQASVVISDASETKHNTQVVQIQGNQVGNVEKVLVDSYKIPRKHLKGLDLAVKKKNKKR